MPCFNPDSRVPREDIKHNIIDKSLRSKMSARPTLTPPIRFLFIDSRFCSALPSDPHHAVALALRYSFTSIRLDERLSFRALNMIGTIFRRYRG